MEIGDSCRGYCQCFESASIPAHEDTLAELLQDAGYYTAGFASTYCIKGSLGFSQGFDHFDDTLSTRPVENKARAEEVLRVPLLVRYPRGAAAERVEERMVQNIDLAPTILDIAGVEIPRGMQGRSLRPLLEGGAARDWRQSIYYSYYENSWVLHGKGREAMADPSFKYFTPHRVGPHRGVRTGRHKLIHYYGEADYWELFDLQEDPHELRNVYSQTRHAALVAQLKTELHRLRRHYGDE